MSRSVLAFLAIVWTCPAVGGEQPGLLFHLSFDRQTVTADFAAGEGRAPSIANPPGWKFVPGVKGLGVVMQPDQRGTFPLAKNYWRNKEWGDPQEQTVCDEVRIFDRVLTDDEIVDLYAADSPDSVPRAAPTLVVELLPSYSAKSLAIQVRPAHLDAVWKERVATGATLAVGVRDPRGGVCFSYSGPSERQQFTAQLPDWYDGAYVADAQLSVHGQSLQGQATLTRPPTPWLPAQQDRRAPRVLPPWTPLTRRDGPKHGHMIHYWNGEVTLADPFPTQLLVRGQPLLAGPIRLVASPAATWDEGRVTEQQPQRITLSGAGRLGDLSATFSTLMEFDGLLRTDLTLTPPPAGAELSSLVLEIPLRPEVTTFYRNPVCRPWDGQTLDEADFQPYAWLGNDERGLSWFMESAANWLRASGQPASSVRREQDAVVVRLHIIGRSVRVTKPLTYTFGFEATPVRPLSPQLYDWRFGSGAPIRGSNLFVAWQQPWRTAYRSGLEASTPEWSKRSGMLNRCSACATRNSFRSGSSET